MNSGAQQSQLFELSLGPDIYNIILLPVNHLVILKMSLISENVLSTM